MRSQKDSTRRSPESAFSPDFLRRLRAEARRTPPPTTAEEATFAGPWHLEPTPEGDWAVLPAGRRLAAGDRPFAVFQRREAALRLVAVLPARGRQPSYHLGAIRHEAGYPLHRQREFEGHLDRYDPDLLPWLALADALARDPWAHAHLLAAVGPRAVAEVGRLLVSLLEGTAEAEEPALREVTT